MSPLRLLGYLWLTPTTLMGLCWLLPMWCLGQIRPVRWRDGAWEWVVVEGSNYWKTFTIRDGWAGVTLGYTIFFSPEYIDNKAVGIHERRHIWQGLFLGPFMLPVWYLLTKIYGYQGNPLEVDAYAFEAANK